jgi:hypothetical protein
VATLTSLAKCVIRKEKRSFYCKMKHRYRRVLPHRYVLPSQGHHSNIMYTTDNGRRLAHYHRSHKGVTSINMGKSETKSPTDVFEQTSDRFTTYTVNRYTMRSSEIKRTANINTRDNCPLVSRHELLKQNYQNTDSSDLQFKQSIDVTILTSTLLHRGIVTRDTEQQNE